MIAIPTAAIAIPAIAPGESGWWNPTTWIATAPSAPSAAHAAYAIPTGILLSASEKITSEVTYAVMLGTSHSGLAMPFANFKQVSPVSSHATATMKKTRVMLIEPSEREPGPGV